MSAALVAHSETKIGVANVQQAILQSEAGKKLVEQINANFSEQDEALKKNKQKSLPPRKTKKRH